MKKTVAVIFMLIPMVAFSTSAPAHELGFETVTIGETKFSEDGYDWDITGNNWFGNLSGYAHSGTKYMLANGGRLGLASGDEFSISSMWVRLYGGSNYTVYVKGYRDGSEIYSETYPAGVITTTFQQLVLNWNNIDQLYAAIGSTALLIDDISYTGPATTPTVTTSAVSAVTTTTASCGGNVTSDGGDVVSVRGVCWNTTGSPTILDSLTSDGAGTGVFTSSVTGLTGATTYYLRAYATNSKGTAYGGERVFRTTETAGASGQQVRVSISEGGDPPNYLTLSKTGDGSSDVTGETFPGSITHRSDVIWGIEETGSVTADVVFDYSGIGGITVPGAIHLLKRADAVSPWTDITSDYTHDTGSRTFSRTGVTEFSQYSIGDAGDNPLPIELSSFTAIAGNGQVTLKWTTGSEINNEAFLLERSEDNEDYVQIAQICGQGSSSKGHEYEFVDQNVTAGKTYYYRLANRNYSGIITYHQTISITASKELPGKFALYPNYPNPFNPETTIRFDVPTTGSELKQVKLVIFNSLGQLVKTLYDEAFSGGEYEIKWDGKDSRDVILPSGVYFIHFQSADFVRTRKMVLLR